MRCDSDSFLIHEPITIHGPGSVTVGLFRYGIINYNMKYEYEWMNHIFLLLSLYDNDCTESMIWYDMIWWYWLIYEWYGQSHMSHLVIWDDMNRIDYQSTLRQWKCGFWSEFRSSNSNSSHYPGPLAKTTEQRARQRGFSHRFDGPRRSFHFKIAKFLHGTVVSYNPSILLVQILPWCQMPTTAFATWQILDSFLLVQRLFHQVDTVGFQFATGHSKAFAISLLPALAPPPCLTGRM